MHQRHSAVDTIKMKSVFFFSHRFLFFRLLKKKKKNILRGMGSARGEVALLSLHLLLGASAYVGQEREKKRPIQQHTQCANDMLLKWQKATGCVAMQGEYLKKRKKRFVASYVLGFGLGMQAGMCQGETNTTKKQAKQTNKQKLRYVVLCAASFLSVHVEVFLIASAPLTYQLGYLNK